jgi:hypothetical protein
MCISIAAGRPGSVIMSNDSDCVVFSGSRARALVQGKKSTNILVDIDALVRRNPADFARFDWFGGFPFALACLLCDSDHGKFNGTKPRGLPGVGLASARMAVSNSMEVLWPCATTIITPANTIANLSALVLTTCDELQLDHDQRIQLVDLVQRVLCIPTPVLREWHDDIVIVPLSLAAGFIFPETGIDDLFSCMREYWSDVNVTTKSDVLVPTLDQVPPLFDTAVSRGDLQTLLALPSSLRTCFLGSFRHVKENCPGDVYYLGNNGEATLGKFFTAVEAGEFAFDVDLERAMMKLLVGGGVSLVWARALDTRLLQALGSPLQDKMDKPTWEACTPPTSPTRPLLLHLTRARVEEVGALRDRGAPRRPWERTCEFEKGHHSLCH